MTIDDQITSARYDLRDENSTQYPDLLLLNYFNRVVRVLYSYLADRKSDWVFGFVGSTLSSGNNSLTLPTDFASTRKVMLSTTEEIFKESVQKILEWQQENYSGSPDYYAENKLTMVFDREASSDLTINIYYNIKPTALVLTDSMPLNDEYNDSLTAAVVMLAKSRNNRDIIQDHALYEFFQGAEASKTMKRAYAPKPKTDY